MVPFGTEDGIHADVAATCVCREAAHLGVWLQGRPCLRSQTAVGNRWGCGCHIHKDLQHMTRNTKY